MGGGEAAAAGDAGAVDQGDGQRVLPQDRLEEVAEALRVLQVLLGSRVPERAQMLQVGAGREVLQNYFLFPLAQGLNLLNDLLHALGKRAEALAANRELVELFRRTSDSGLQDFIS